MILGETLIYASVALSILPRSISMWLFFLFSSIEIH